MRYFGEINAVNPSLNRIFNGLYIQIGKVFWYIIAEDMKADGDIAADMERMMGLWIPKGSEHLLHNAGKKRI